MRENLSKFEKGDCLPRSMTTYATSHEDTHTFDDTTQSKLKNCVDGNERSTRDRWQCNESTVSAVSENYLRSKKGKATLAKLQ